MSLPLFFSGHMTKSFKFCINPATKKSDIDAEMLPLRDKSRFLRPCNLMTRHERCFVLAWKFSCTRTSCTFLASGPRKAPFSLISEELRSAASHSVPAATSRFFPRVSLTKNQQKTVAKTSNPMNIKKVLAPTFWIIYVLAKEKQNDAAQWASMLTAKPSARMRVGKISGTYAQGRGPHEQL